MTEIQFVGNYFCLAEAARSIGTVIHFEQTYDVGLCRLQKSDDLFEIMAALSKVAAEGNRQMKMQTSARGVPDIVKQKTHAA
jgi:hypothetical protein